MVQCRRSERGLQPLRPRCRSGRRNSARESVAPENAGRNSSLNPTRSGLGLNSTPLLAGGQLENPRHALGGAVDCFVDVSARFFYDLVDNQPSVHGSRHQPAPRAPTVWTVFSPKLNRDHVELVLEMAKPRLDSLLRVHP